MVLDHVSYTQFGMWQRCPRQWKYRYVDGLRIPPGGAQIEGRCYHKSVEVNFVQKVASFKDLPVEDCLDAFATEWDKNLSEEEFIDWEDRNPGAIKDEGYSLVSEYMVVQAPRVQPLEVEEWYISEVAGAKFVIRIDLMDDTGTVIDHKTAKRSYNQADVDKDLQASAAAFSLDRPILFQNHVAIKSVHPRIQVVKTVRTREDIEWWLDLASGIVTQMKIGVAPPNPNGWWCSPNYCGFYGLCRGGLIRGYW